MSWIILGFGVVIGVFGVMVTYNYMKKTSPRYGYGYDDQGNIL